MHLIFRKEERVRPRSNKLLKLECFRKLAKIKKVVETVLPVKAAKEEIVAELEDEFEVEDNTYVGESRSAITE